MFDIFEIIQLAIILAVSIGLHEYAHAYASHKLGDPTPKLQGRLTPNPLKHIDPIGFLMIFVIHFGRGKPVQINPMYYKDRRIGEFLVAMAGPATNIILAFFGVLLIVLYTKFGSLGQYIDASEPFTYFWKLFSSINVTLAIFNMIPIPPLDGFRLIKMISWKFGEFIEQYSIYISMFFLLVILRADIIGNFLSKTSVWVLDLFFAILGQIFY